MKKYFNKKVLAALAALAAAAGLISNDEARIVETVISAFNVFGGA